MTHLPPRRHRRLIAAGLLPLLLLSLLLPATATNAADATASPALRTDLRLTAEPLLGGTVRPGAWMAVRVHLENDGPAIDGELRVTGGQTGDSRYGVRVQLATGARQDHVLYAQPSWFGAKLALSLVSGADVLASQTLRTVAIDPYTATIVVVAERPEGIVGDLRAGALVPQFGNQVVIIPVRPEDLPPRVEAWSAIDRLVWQDTDSQRLSPEQLEALRTWVSAGGRFILVGGSSGITGLGAFPADLLPYRPSLTVDVPLSDLGTLLGTLPSEARGEPAIAGILDRGTVLGRSGDHVIAAQAAIGQGTVTIIGVNPATPWFAGTSAATAFWRRLLPPNYNGTLNPLALQDDSQVVGALNNLPAVALPDIVLLFGLLLLYIALIGPVNYVVLRRLDRREWAWVTMPTLVLVFAVAAYGVGLGLKGTDVIVNQVGIVRGAAGSDRGIGQFYVGIFSPTRKTYDLKVGNGALLTNPAYLAQQGTTPVPLDVLVGDPSELRGYQVGFGVLRAFRAETAVLAPRVDAALSYHDGTLSGTLTNRSDKLLESVAVVYGSGVAVLPSLAPGETLPVTLDVTSRVTFGTQLSERIFGRQDQSGQVARETYTRRTLIDQLTFWSDTLGGNGAMQQGPVILAWTHAAGIDVGVESEAEQESDTLALLPAIAVIRGPTVFPNALVGHTVRETRANESFDQGTTFSLSRGTMVVDFRPMGFSGELRPTELALALTQGDVRPIAGGGKELEPLPDAEQPDQTDPVGTEVRGSADGLLPADRKPVLFDGLPDLQLYDHIARRWVEFSHPTGGLEFRVPSPERYVDPTGAFSARFVNRADQNNSTYFSLVVRLEGDAG
jgi:hypothetical protein